MSGEDIIKEIAENIKPTGELLKLAVLTSGDGGNLQALIDHAIKTAHFQIKVVITNNKKSLAREKAQKANIESYFIDHRHKSRASFENELIAHMSGVDLVVLAGFLRVFSPEFLKHFPKRVINLHPSLLPKYPGLDAINQALGSDISGCTVHLVDEGLDTGPIIAQLSCPVLATDDTLSLKTRIQALEHRLLPSVVEKIAHAWSLK